MSKDEEEARMEEILENIKDPAVREHYRAQLKMAAELESEGVVTAYHDVDVFREERERRENEDQEQFAELVAEKIAERQKPSLLRTVASIVLLALLIVVAVEVLCIVAFAFWKQWPLW